MHITSKDTHTIHQKLYIEGHIVQVTLHMQHAMQYSRKQICRDMQCNASESIYTINRNKKKVSKDKKGNKYINILK